MVSSAVGFCPGHISGYFKRINRGSAGAGIIISEGVTATAVPADSTKVTVVSGMCPTLHGSPPLEWVMDRLGVTAHVKTECSLPVGSGFGLSAAALLSAITAMNALFDIGMSRNEIAALAHEAELRHMTGLGDVPAAQAGGLACRKGPGIDTEIVRLSDYRGEIAAVNFGPLHTADILGSDERMQRIADAFPGKCPSDLNEFFTLSRSFSEKSRLITPEIQTALEACDRHSVPASMTMLGNGVFACGEEAKEVLGQFGRVITMNIATEGFHLIEVKK